MATDADRQTAAFSFVTEYETAPPEVARQHFLAKLAVETDPADLHVDLGRGQKLVVIDARSPDAYQDCHIPRSISLPHRSISPATTADIPIDHVVVTYCWGPGCNAATKAAAKLAGLGFQVKEMIGGLEYWRQEGLPVEGNLGEAAPLHG